MTSASDMAACTGIAGGLAAGEEKAAWYREVLDIEPGSKVFLPFARLLLELGRADEAVSVLRDGLGRHPEFMEARLLLIDVLHKRGEPAACGSEVARLAGLFRSHPDFWEAWGDVSASAGSAPDLAVSLNFLGALFRNERLTLADVLAAGLKALRESPAGREAATTPGAPVADAPLMTSSGEVLEKARRAVPSEIPPRGGASAPSFAALSPCGSAPGGMAASGVAVGEGGPAPSALSPRSEAGQEKCSLRTRSMAEVLAEQGDVRGAVDIYEELLAACRSEDRAALASRLEDLRARLGVEGGASPVARASASAPARPMPPTRNGMLDLLEKLAVRLETKARQ